MKKIIIFIMLPAYIYPIVEKPISEPLPSTGVELPEYKPEFEEPKPVPAQELSPEQQQAQDDYSSAAQDYYQKQTESATQEQQFNAAVQKGEAGGYTDEQIEQMKQNLEASKQAEAASLESYKAAQQEYKDVSGSKGKTSAIEQVATHEARKTEQLTRQDVTKQVKEMKESSTKPAEFVEKVREAMLDAVYRGDKSSELYFLQDALDTLNNPADPTMQELQELEQLVIDLKTQRAINQKDIFNVVDWQRYNIRQNYKSKVKLTELENNIQNKLLEIYGYAPKIGYEAELKFSQAITPEEKKAFGRPKYEVTIKNLSVSDRPKMYKEYSKQLFANGILASADDVANLFNKKFYTVRVIDDLDNLNVFALKTNAKEAPVLVVKGSTEVGDLSTTYLEDFVKFMKSTLSELFDGWQNLNAALLEKIKKQIKTKQANVDSINKTIARGKNGSRSGEQKNELTKVQIDLNNTTAEGRMRSELNQLAKQLNSGGFKVRFGGVQEFTYPTETSE